MPNWCMTNVTFYSKSENQIKRLHDVLSELDEGESLLPNGFGNLWLGNILHYFGFDWEKIYCRGSISFFGITTQDADGRFYFEVGQEDAWSPKKEVWDAVLSKEEFSDVEYVYMAEEPGCGLYLNSDSSGLFYEDRYTVDVYLDGKFYNDKTCSYNQEYFTSEDECLEYLREISENLGNKQEFATVTEANDWFSNFLDDDASWVMAHEYQLP